MKSTNGVKIATGFLLSDETDLKDTANYSREYLTHFVYGCRECGLVLSNGYLEDGRCPEHPDIALKPVKLWRIPGSTLDQARREGKLVRRRRCQKGFYTGADIKDYLRGTHQSKQELPHNEERVV